ncbi:MAG: hypothetical protein AAGM29_18010, partial [Cyanobacteria bacterium J06588_4]
AAYAADRRRSPFGAVRPGGLEARGFVRLESFAFARTALMRQRCEATQPANAGRRDAERRFGRMPCPRSRLWVARHCLMINVQ